MVGTDRKEVWKKDREPGGPVTHLSQVRSVPTLAVASSNAERATDVRPWTEIPDDVGVGYSVGGRLGLAGGDGEVALRPRLDVDRLCVC